MDLALEGRDEGDPGGMWWRQSKKGKKKIFWYPAQKKTQPWSDCSNASCWYGRLRGPILSLSVFRINSFQIWSQSFPLWNFFIKIFLQKSWLLPLPNNCGFKVTTDPNRDQRFELKSGTLRVSSFWIPTSIFVPKICKILICFHPLPGGTWSKNCGVKVAAVQCGAVGAGCRVNFRYSKNWTEMGEI